MTTLIIIFICLAIFHFVYDGIILPSIRWSIRLKYFNLRDKLRRLKIEKNNELSNQLFEFGENTLNISIDNIYRFDLLLIYKSYQFYKKNESFRSIVDKRENFINNIKDKEFISIIDEHISLSFKIIIANNFILLLYCSIVIFPLIFLYFIMKLLPEKKEKIDKTLLAPTIVSENNFNNFFGRPETSFNYC